MSRGLPRVLVLTGTSDHPFPRLLNALPALVREGAASEVRIQCATAVPAAPGLVALGMLANDEFKKELAEADVVVTHGGSGSCFEAIRAGHRPIIVPRSVALAEHVDDHQTEIAHALAAQGCAVAVAGECAESLARALATEVRAAPPRLPRPPPCARSIGDRLLALAGALRVGMSPRPRGLRVEQVSAAEFDTHYRNCPRPHPLQSTAWGEARRRDGWHPEWWIAFGDGRSLAGAQVLRRLGPVSPGYVPFGPALSSSPRAVTAGRALLMRLSRANVGGLFWVPYPNPHHVPLIAGVPSAPLDRPSQTGFVRLGSDEEMLANLRAKWRGALRKGLRNPGLSVVQNDPLVFVPKILERVRGLAKEKGFKPPVAPEVGREFAERAQKAGVRLLCLSVYEGGRETNQYVASIVGQWAHTLWSVHEPDADGGAGRVALWTLLRLCRDAGCAHYDLSGIDDDDNPGVASFKRGLSPVVLQVPGIRWIPPFWIPLRLATHVAQIAASLRGSRS